ncbi:MAG: hypothetical protein ABW092_11770 [Candidatus Thiodiazotropha sp.]
METNPYSTPKSEVVKESDAISINASFSSLNFWRKLYLVFIWTISIAMSIAFLATMTKSDTANIPVIIGLAALILGFAYWTHWAIVKRNVGHITILAIINLIPGGNIIGCLIMFSIRGTTVNELKRFNLRDT